jgi:hypothetical protein
MDPASPEFIRILKDSLGIVYPSSAEGCATSVLLTMHAGLIPIVSKETGVGVEDFGIMLADCSVTTVQETVRRLASETPERLKERSRAARTYVRNHHTRALFAQKYALFVDMLERKYGKR